MFNMFRSLCRLRVAVCIAALNLVGFPAIAQDVPDEDAVETVAEVEAPAVESPPAEVQPIEEEPKRETPTQQAEGPSPDELALIEASLAADAEEVIQPEPLAPSVIGAVDSMTLDIALILDVAAAWFSDEPRQTGAHDPSRTGFTLQQLEMSIGSNIDPYFRIDTNLVFAEFGVEVEEAYVTTLALPANFQARAGQFLTKFGRQNPTHPHAWKFLDQPLVMGKFFGGENSRGLGAEVSWLSPLPWFAELIASTNMANGECCARSFFGGDDPGVNGPEDLLYTTALKQFFDLHQDWGLLWGLSAQFGPNSTGFENRSEIYGTDLTLRYRPVDSVDRTALTLQIEAMLRRRQIPRDVLQDFGAYAQLIWQVNPRWETGARYEFVSGLEDDPIDPEWLEDRQRVSTQLTFYPSHFSRLRLQGAWDQAGTDSTFAIMLGLEVLAGAHGAHEY